MKDIFTEIIEKNHPELPVLSILQGSGTVLRDSSDRRIIYDKTNLSSYKAMEIGDFIIHLRSFEGGLECSNHHGISSPAYKILRTKCLISEAYMDYFRSYMFVHGKLSIAVTGIRDGKSIDMPSFWGIKISFPTINEQRKIAAFLMLLKKRIKKQQQLVELLKSYKRGALSRLFTKNGSRVPEYRFSGFTGDWEQRKLGEICQVTMGQSPDGSTYSEEPSDYILVQGNADLKDGWVSPRVWTTQKTKTAQAGDLIMSVRAPAGAMGKTAYDVVLGRGVAGIKGNEFVYQLLVKIDSDGYWKKMAAGSTFESVNSDVVNNAEITIPKDMEEQEKIGAYFIRLDTLTTLHQKKVEQYINLKQFMLEKLFI